MKRKAIVAAGALFCVAAVTLGGCASMPEDAFKLAPTTLRDFDQPGSQPLEAGILNDPTACAACHADYDPSVEPYYNW